MIPWTPDAIQFLRDNAGKISTSEIALKLGTGHNRAAVIGKMHRLKLTGLPQGLRLGFKKRTPNDRNATTSANKPRAKWSKKKQDVSRTRSTPFRAPTASHVEPTMPVLEDGAPILHSRPYADLEDGMCKWPVYQEQGVQMYCAAAVERLPGRWATYCACHGMASGQPRAERERKYRRGIWAK